jgi:hypothetical protein
LAGQPVQAYVEAIIEDVLDAESAQYDWESDEARWTEYERTGEGISAEAALAEFKDSLAERFSMRR